MTVERMKHVQQTFLALGDEFLIQYFLSAHKEFRAKQILSRLFSMGHSLELYAKAALVSPTGVPPTGHDVPGLIATHDPALALSSEEVLAGKALFGSDVSNVDLGLWLQHEEAMELYQAEYFLKDLKYYLTKDQKVISPARMSLKPVNGRYLELVKSLRTAVKYRDPEASRRCCRASAVLRLQTQSVRRSSAVTRGSSASTDSGGTRHRDVRLQRKTPTSVRLRVLHGHRELSRRSP